MTVSTTTSREQYAANGVTVAFTIHFPFFDDTDVNAIFVDSLGNSTTFVLSTDFTVSGGSGAGGTLTTTVAPSNGGTLTIFREIPFTAEIDFVENDPLPAADLNEVEDRAVMRDQQLQDASDRSLTFPPTIDPSVSAVLPSPVADSILGWNSGATALENKTLPAGTAVYSSITNTKLGIATGEAVTPDALAALWQEGVALVSAASISKPADANLGGFFTQSGSTGTNTMWAGVKGGEEMEIRYTGAPLLGISGNLVPPTAAAFQIVAGDIIRWRWDASATKWRAMGGIRVTGAAFASGGLPTGFIRGVTLANDVGDANNDIDISTGSARDSTDAGDMVLAVALIKRLDAVWFVGTNQGGLDTGAKANSTWYHYWLIKRTDTGVVDVLISLSATAPAMPTNYTLKRRIGSVLTDGSGNIRAFTQRRSGVNREFYWNTPQIDLDAVNPGVAAVSRTLSTPLGVSTKAQISMGMFCNSTSTQPVGYVSDLSRADIAPLAILAASVSGAGGQVTAVNDASNAWNWGQVAVWTDTSSAVRSRVTASDAVTRIGIITHGWEEDL